jgi:hypothetical protein
MGRSDDCVRARAFAGHTQTRAGGRGVGGSGVERREIGFARLLAFDWRVSEPVKKERDGDASL